MDYTCQKYTVHFFHMDYRMATLSFYAENERKLMAIAHRKARFLRQAGKRPTHMKVNDGLRIDVEKVCYTYKR